MKQAKMTLVKEYTVGEVDERIFGSFIEHWNRAVYTGIYEPGHPLADENGFRKDVLEAVKRLRVPTVRYPGGNFVSGYNWEDGVGPREKRPRRLERAWGVTESNQFGTNEFIQWCRAANTAPMLAVNLGTRGPEEAGNLVEYCNHPGGTYWSDLRRTHGFEQPHGVKLWCLGNEMDGSWQIGAKTAQEYGRIADETAKMIRWTDPGIELVLCGSSGCGTRTFGDWEATVLDHAYERIDYISLHQYFDNKQQDSQNFLAGAVWLENYIETVAHICDYIQGKKRSKHKVHLSFDEWNVWHTGTDKPHTPWLELPPANPCIYNFEDALLVGTILIGLLKHCDRVKIACLAQLVNAIAPIVAVEGGPAWAQTIYHPFLHTSHYGRGTALLPVLDSPKHDTVELCDVPDVTAVAIHETEAQSIAIFAVNRNFTEEMAFEINLHNFAGMRPCEHIVLAGYDLKQENSAEKQVVVPANAPLPTRDGNQITAILKPLSWNVIRLECDKI